MRTSFFLRTLSVSSIRSDYVQTLLVVCGMALGIAVYCSIRVASLSSEQSFSDSAAMLRSPESLSLSASGGVPESVIATLRSIPEIKQIAPYSERTIEAFVGNKSLGAIRLIGIDPFSLPTDRVSTNSAAPGRLFEFLSKRNAVLLSPELNRQLGDKTFHLIVNTVSQEMVSLGVISTGILPTDYTGKIAFIDIAHFQELFQSFGAVQRFDLTPADGVSRSVLRERLAQVLPEEISIGDTESDIAGAERLTAAFRLNLNFLSAVALFSGVLLIYNTASSLFLKRRREFSILRSIGASPGELFRYIISEAAILGFIAAAVGICFGYFLAFQSVTMMARTISALYVATEARPVTLPLQTVLECFILGPALAIVGSSIPAYEIFYLPSREGLSYQSFESRFQRFVMPLAVVGIAALGATFLTARPELLAKDLRLGFVPPICLVVGMSLLVPFVLRAFARALLAAPIRLVGVESRLALDHVLLTLKRSSVAVAAVMVALGMYLGVTMMIESFRTTVTTWINHITPADIYISAEGVSRGGSGTGLPEEMVEFASRLPNVRDYDWVTSRKVRVDDREIFLHGIRLKNLLLSQRLLFRSSWPHGGGDNELREAASGNDTILISEPFANHTGFKEGDWITLSLRGKKEEFRVRNVFIDYSSDQGAAYISSQRFERIFGDLRKEGVSLYVNGDTAPIMDRIRNEFPTRAFSMRDNQSLRSEVLHVFDQTFAITKALKLIALIISAFTLFHVVFMLTLDRARELGVFRAIGASRRQLVKMIAAESVILGLSAALMGTALGVALEIILVKVIHRYFFGWTMSLVIPYTVLIVTFISAIVVSIIVGVVPAWTGARKIDSTVLRYE